MLLDHELDDLQARAAARVKEFPAQRLVVLSDECRALAGNFRRQGLAEGEIQRAILHHALSPEAGLWSADFVRKLLNLPAQPAAVLA